MIEILILIFVWFFLIWALSLAPFVPTFWKDLKRVDNAVWLKPWQKFIEIWCWTARVSRYLALNNPEAEITWLEIVFPLYIYCKLKAFIFWPKNFKIKFWNAKKYSYKDIDVVYIFWVPDTVSGNIKNKVYDEINKWWKYVSYTFEVKDWKWKIKVDKWNSKENKIYICTK